MSKSLPHFAARACLLLYLLLTSTGDSFAESLSSSEVNICIPDVSILPFYKIEGNRISGLAVEHLNMLFAQIKLKNIEPKFSVAPWQRCLAKLEQNETDLLIAGHSAERAEIAIFPDALGYSLEEYAFSSTQICLVRRKNAKWKWDGLYFSETSKLILGIEPGFQRSQIEQPNVKVTYSDIWEAKYKYQLITRKRIDAALTVCGLRGFQYIPDSKKIGAELEVISPPYISSNVHLAFSKGFFASYPDLTATIYNTAQKLDLAKLYGQL